jgi:glucosamine-6-phosphate deaminase
MKPKVIVFEDSQEISKYAVDIIAKALVKKPNLVFGVPTGKTVIPIYQELTKTYKEKNLNFSKTKVFALDEYRGLKPGQKQTFKYYLDKNLFTRINFKEENINFLNGSAINIKKECEQYEEKIKKAGGIDLMFLGLGVNGHIAFNEPGSQPKSRTREIVLTYQTRTSNFGMIGSLIKAPKRGLTIGIATILDSKKIVLIATGAHKAKAVKAMLESPIGPDCPATFLRNHKDATILLDKKAASLLEKKH